MTPDRRLDQLEPLMAESLQKIDRLIEGQGQLVESQGQILEIVTRADQKADITAKGVAELTVSTQKQFEELRASQENLQASQDQLRAGQEALKVGQDLILEILREKLP